MAYNRDWDKGKDHWADQSYWPTDTKENVRGREDDYYGDGKRRKYNHGASVLPSATALTGSHSSQGYDTQSYDEPYESNYVQPNPSRHTDAAPDYTPHDDRHGKGFHSKKRLVPSEPSSHVIFLGLDPDFSEADVCRYTLHVLRYKAESIFAL